MTQKISTKTSYPPKNSFFWPPPPQKKKKIISKIKILNPQKWPEPTYVWKYHIPPPPPPPGHRAPSLDAINNLVVFPCEYTHVYPIDTCGAFALLWWYLLAYRNIYICWFNENLFHKPHSSSFWHTCARAIVKVYMGPRPYWKQANVRLKHGTCMNM